MGVEVMLRPSQDRNRLSDSAFDLHKKLLKGRHSIELHADSTRPTENGSAQPDTYQQEKKQDSAERPYEAPLSEDDPEWAKHETTSEVDPKDEPTPDRWVPRHKAIVRLTGRSVFTSSQAAVEGGNLCSLRSTELLLLLQASSQLRASSQHAYGARLSHTQCAALRQKPWTGSKARLGDAQGHCWRQPQAASVFQHERAYRHLRVCDFPGHFDLCWKSKKGAEPGEEVRGLQLGSLRPIQQLLDRHTLV